MTLQLIPASLRAFETAAVKPTDPNAEFTVNVIHAARKSIGKPAVMASDSSKMIESPSSSRKEHTIGIELRSVETATVEYT